MTIDEARMLLTLLQIDFLDAGNSGTQSQLFAEDFSVWLVKGLIEVLEYVEDEVNIYTISHECRDSTEFVSLIESLAKREP